MSPLPFILTFLYQHSAFVSKGNRHLSSARFRLPALHSSRRARRACWFLASKILQPLWTESCVQISKMPFVCIAEDKTTAASVPSPFEDFLFARTKTNTTSGATQAGRKKVQKLYFQKMLFSAQLHGEKGRNDRLSDTRGGGVGKRTWQMKRSAGGCYITGACSDPT